MREDRGRACALLTPSPLTASDRRAIVRAFGRVQTFVGSKTEQALLNFCKLLNGDYMAIRQVRVPPC